LPVPHRLRETPAQIVRDRLDLRAAVLVGDACLSP
jgi:hypothetical protein